MLEGLGNDMENTQSKMDSVLRKMAKVTHMSNGKLTCVACGGWKKQSFQWNFTRNKLVALVNIYIGVVNLGYNSLEKPPKFEGNLHIFQHGLCVSRGFI